MNYYIKIKYCKYLRASIPRPKFENKVFVGLDKNKWANILKTNGLIQSS